MAFEETSGGLGGLGGFMSGLGNKLGSNDMLSALALLDAGRAQVNRPPLAQTLAPIMALQAKKQDQDRERAALSAVLQKQYGLPKDQADLWAASDKAAGFGVQGIQLQRQQDMINKAQSGLDSLIGGGASTPQKRSDATDLPDAATPFHNLVANAEGTAQGRGYDETLGYGKFTNGPVNLTGMKVGDVLGLQQQMLRHPENNLNSSAAGAYQVVGKTLRGLVDQGVVSPDDPYDAATQNKIASFLAQQRGPNPAALRSEWAGLKNVPDAQIVQAWNASFGGGQPGHLTEPPPMNLGAAADTPATQPFAWNNTSTKEAADAQDAARLRQLTQGTDTPTQVASNDPNFVPLPPQRPAGLGDDGKPASQVLVEQQQAREANAPLPPLPAAQVSLKAKMTQDAQRAEQGLLSRTEALQTAAAIAKLGLAYEGAGVKGAADNLKPFTEFYLGQAKPTDAARAAADLGLQAGTPEHRSFLREFYDKRPSSLKEADVLNPNDRAAGLRELKQLEDSKNEDAYNAKVGAGLGETVSNMYGQYASAYDPATVNLRQMQVMKDLTQNPNLYIGAGGEAVNELKKRALAVGQFLGMSEDQLKDLRAGASAGEVMQKIARQYAAGTAQSQVGSRVTNFELDTILKSNPGMASTPQGAQLMLDLMMRNEQRKIDLSNAVVAYAENTDKKPTVSGMRKIAEEYDAKNPLITDDIKKRLMGIPNAGTAPAEAPAKAEAKPAPPQRGAIEDGYRFLGGDPKNPKSWRKEQ